MADSNDDDTSAKPLSCELTSCDGDDEREDDDVISSEPTDLASQLAQVRQLFVRSWRLVLILVAGFLSRVTAHCFSLFATALVIAQTMD